MFYIFTKWNENMGWLCENRFILQEDMASDIEGDA